MEQAAENVVAKRPSVLGKLKAPCVHGAGEKKKISRTGGTMNMNEALQTIVMRQALAGAGQVPGLAEGPAPEEILHHSYEYTVREDILMSMEELTLSEAETRALLLSPLAYGDPLRQVLRSGNRLHGHDPRQHRGHGKRRSKKAPGSAGLSLPRRSRAGTKGSWTFTARPSAPM